MKQFTLTDALTYHANGYVIESVDSGRTFMKGWEEDADEEVRNSQSMRKNEEDGLWLVYRPQQSKEGEVYV